jgi:hypothetical protein
MFNPLTRPSFWSITLNEGSQPNLLGPSELRLLLAAITGVEIGVKIPNAETGRDEDSIVTTQNGVEMRLPYTISTQNLKVKLQEIEHLVSIRSINKSLTSHEREIVERLLVTIKKRKTENGQEVQQEVATMEGGRRRFV